MVKFEDGAHVSWKVKGGSDAKGIVIHHSQDGQVNVDCGNGRVAWMDPEKLTLLVKVKNGY